MPEFNSEESRQIAAEEIDTWATEYHDAAKALKTLVLDLIRTRKIVGDKAFIAEIKRMEV